MVWKMGSISHLTIRKFHVQTYINNVFKRGNVKSVLLCLMKRNNVIDYAPQNYMAFTDQLIGLGHWSNDGPTGHPGIFFEQKENLNLFIACILPLCIGNSETVSPGNSLVQFWMENCITNLQSLKEGDTSNKTPPQETAEAVIFKWFPWCTFLQGTNCIQLIS